MHVPLIDWQNFDEAQFEQAYTEVGFARLYNIWTEQEQVTMSNWFSAVESWFKQSTNKTDYEATGDILDGWVDIGQQFLSPFRRNDFKETFEIETLHDPSVVPPALSSQLKQALPILHNTGLNCLKKFEHLLRCNYLVELHESIYHHHIRTAFYPATEARKNQLPCGEHKDYNSITLLFSPDAHKRLQIKDRQGEWHDIRYRPNSVVVNIGNIMQKWTNNYLTSAVHRVLPSNADSFTTAYFMYPHKQTALHMIGPKAVTQKHPVTVEQALKLFDKAKQDARSRVGI